MTNYLLLAGSNIGDKALHLMNALEAITKVAKLDLQLSRIYKSDAWGFEAEECFMNQAISFKSSLPPNEILNHLLEIEKQMGRVRKTGSGYESRVIDIDILLAKDIVLNSDTLIIPHPRLHLRRFALAPAAEIAGNWVHPIFNKIISDLLIECQDTSSVEPIE